ncbi:MAG: hypothetical protein ACI4ET_06605 [Bilifractor sp.]
MAKKIWRGTVLIPLTVMFMILTSYFTISIPEIKLYWNRGITLFYCVFVMVGWFSCSSMRKSCCNGHFTELLFNLVPIELISMPIFAQWHFAVTILITLAFVLIEIFLFLRVRREENKHCFSEKRHRYYRTIFCRCSLLIALIMTAIPCVFSAAVYDFRSPSFEADKEIWDRLTSEQSKKNAPDNKNLNNPYDSNSALFSCFEESAWKQLDASERITIMQKLVDFESAQLGIPSVPVRTEKLEPFTLGKYRDETKEIWIDLEHLMVSPVDECISTICHEVYHAAQHYIIENVDWNNEVFQSTYFNELRSWRTNEENYKSPAISGFDSYENQPLEVSARQYAHDETKKILKYVDD